MEVRPDDPPMAKLGNHDDPLGSSSGMGARGIIGGAFVVPVEVGVDGSVEDFWLKIIKKIKINTLSHNYLIHSHIVEIIYLSDMYYLVDAGQNVMV